MLSLAKLQQSVRESIHSGDATKALSEEIIPGDIDPAARLKIYQNNYREPLAESLLEVFPVVAAFVGTVFTRTALRHYINAEPPIEPCLSSYGSGFSKFLKSYTPAEAVAYISDLAELEWTAHQLQHASENNAQSQQKPSLNENIVLIASVYPLLNLWMVGNGQLRAEAVHLDQGGQFVCIVLHEMKVQFYALGEEEKQTVLALENGETPYCQNTLSSLKNKGIVKL